MTGPGTADPPRISVAIANYNYGRFLQTSLDSVYGQTVAAHEIVVVDDGSTDESRAVLAAQDGRVRAILSENRGVAAATNVAVENCRGDVIALLDSDDLMLPDRLARLQETYVEHADAQWIFHRMGYQDDAGRPVAPPAPPPRLPGGRLDVRAESSRGRLPLSMPATSALSWRTDFLQSIMPMPATVLCQDNYLKFASLACAPGFFVDEELSCQRLHAASLWTSLDTSDRRQRGMTNLLATTIGFERLGGCVLPLAARFTADIVTERALSPSSLTAETRHDLGRHLKALPFERRVAVARATPRAAARAALGRVAQARTTRRSSGEVT